MLKKNNKGWVESDTGYSVHITGLECLKYEDATYEIEVEWNYDPLLDKTYVYASDIQGLDDSEKSMIISNIREAVKLLDGKYEVV